MCPEGSDHLRVVPYAGFRPLFCYPLELRVDSRCLLCTEGGYR